VRECRSPGPAPAGIRPSSLTPEPTIATRALSPLPTLDRHRREVQTPRTMRPSADLQQHSPFVLVWAVMAWSLRFHYASRYSSPCRPSGCSSARSSSSTTAAWLVPQVAPCQRRHRQRLRHPDAHAVPLLAQEPRDPPRHRSRLERRGTGDIWTLTVAEYLGRSRWQRFVYRLYRHPIVLFVVGPALQLVVLHRLPAISPFGGTATAPASCGRTWDRGVYALLCWLLGGAPS